MTNFKNAYDSMNIDEYRNVLHTGYIFVFADGSPAAPTTGIYTREEDLQSTTRMFNGEQGQDLEGVVKPGVRDIEFPAAAPDRLGGGAGDGPLFPGRLPRAVRRAGRLRPEHRIDQHHHDRFAAAVLPEVHRRGAGRRAAPGRTST
ncbi:MAG: hypothetical protein IPI34_10580 [bacterium]|nr:hypothetical protein [bacterium]